MTKRMLSALLTILILLGTSVSCGRADGGAETAKNEGFSSADTEEQESNAVEKDPLMDAIDEHVSELAGGCSFKGQSFTWIGIGYQAPKKDEELGDVQSDAFYFRQREIEERFFIDWINYTPPALEDQGLDPITEAVKQDVLAGTGAYDAGYGMSHTCQPLLVNDCLVDTAEFSVVDIDNPWWCRSIRDSYSINGALYFLNGPILGCYYQDASSVVFNKTVAENYSIGGLYDTVKRGEWTFDRMFEIASAVPENANGTGAYRYGDPDALSTVIAHGLTVTKLDAEGRPYIEENLPIDLSDLADKFCKIYGDDTQTVNCKSSSFGFSREDFSEKYGYENYPEMFEDDRILFLFIPTDEAAYLRQRDVNFGILPMPKGSTAQDNYISYATSRSLFNVFIPKSVKNVEMTDVVVEAMAALGYKYFKTAFYETLLKGRSTKDFDSKDMIDIIFSTKKYDLINVLDKDASVNGDGVLVSLLDDCVVQSTDNFASRFFINSKIVNGNLKMILAKLAADQ